MKMQIAGPYFHPLSFNIVNLTKGISQVKKVYS